MFTGRTVRLAAVTAALTLMLVGCVQAPNASPLPSETLTPIPLPATPSPAAVEWIDRGASFDVIAEVAIIGSYISTIDSGYSFPGQRTDAFPAGTGVLVAKFRIDGFVPFSRADVTGLNLEGTKFDGRAELAVVDGTEGAAFAAANGVAWLPAGLFADAPEPWTLANHEPVEFAAAWYVPPGVTDLEIRLGIPAAPEYPIKLRVPVQTGE